MSRIKFWNETQNVIIVRKTFYKNRFLGTRKMIKNVVKIFSSSQIFCLEVEIFPTSHVKFSKFTRRFCQLHTSSWPTRHVEFLHKTRLITHFMQSYLCGSLLKLLILSKTLCALRIEKIQPPLDSLANKRFSACQFLQKSWQFNLPVLIDKIWIDSFYTTNRLIFLHIWANLFTFVKENAALPKDFYFQDTYND